MPLTPNEISALIDAARKMGVDEKALVAAAEDAGGSDDSAAKEPAKLFQWNSWVLTANELRRALGVEGDAVDGNMYFGEWLLKHGGAALSDKQAGQQEPNGQEET